MRTGTSAAQLAVASGFINDEDVATSAIKRIHLEYLEGEEMKEAVSSTVEILYEEAPDLFGGAVPADDFYYSV
jgi:NitT/TauT family transport system substrate-binding protein